MKLTRKITVALLAAVMAVTISAGLCMLKTAYAYTQSVNIVSAAGDGFAEQGTSYGVNDSFVYSATVNFNSGDAAALTFGGTEDGLWAFNIDRAGNSVKLLYFTASEDGYSAEELLVEDYIGNDKMTASERAIVEPKVKTVSSVSLKIVVTSEDGDVYLECYADGIRRFAYTDGCAEAAPLNIAAAFDRAYSGGNLGFNVCKADVSFTDILTGSHDYSYYTELYRNQFHYSPFSNWNNDPNGLVYYGGYYHLYYQHNPFDSVWSDMYWGHARSKDLIHWENLPVCLFPEKDGYDGCWGSGDGYMWSGSVRVYTRGESSAIDNADWFEGVTGLIGFYTRDGATQEQMIMSSDDGGLTWTKRTLIPSHEILDLGEDKVDCRDPKVFTYEYHGSTVYGMLLTGMSLNAVWFLKSDDLVSWSSAGVFYARVPLVNSDDTNGPECPDIAFMTADDGEELCVITLAGRGYIVGELGFDGDVFTFSINGQNAADMELDEVPVQQMDFGPDSYAAQTFYISEDSDSEYAGQIVSISWFSGVPGASASVDSGLLTQLRDGWNGGMTIPVIWGLTATDGGYVLTQTPVTKDSGENKTVVSMAADYAVAAGEDVFRNLSASVFEIDATISNPSGGAVYFRVRVGDGEYTEIGWNSEEGYYVDRTHTASGNVSLANYAARYTCATADSTELSFYILCDGGALEVFCGNGTAVFYLVVFWSPNSTGVSFISEADVTFTNLKISALSSAWNDGSGDVLSIGNDGVELDLSLCTYEDVLVYGSGTVSYRIAEGSSVATYMVTADGLRIFAESAGSAVIEVTCGSLTDYISVTVYGGEPDADLAFTDINSGAWYSSEDGYKGYTPSGDAFIFSEEEGTDFTYAARFTLSGVAAALVFRASADMSKYVIANYDDNAGLVKLWSSAGDSVEVSKKLSDLSGIVLTVQAYGRDIRVYLNDELIIEHTLSESAPLGGLFGLNVCEAEAQFTTVALTEGVNGQYSGGNVVWNHIDTSALTVVCRTLNNRTVDGGFWSADGRRITLSQNYMASLSSAGVYVFEVRGTDSLYVFEIDVLKVPEAVWEDMTLQENTNAVFFVGSLLSGTVKVNGEEIDGSLYKIDGMQLTVYASALSVGENEVTYADSLSAKVTVEAAELLEEGFNEGNASLIYTALFITVGAVIAAELAFIAVISLRKGRKDVGND